MTLCAVCAAPATHNSRIRGTAIWTPVCSRACADEYYGDQEIGGLIDRLRKTTKPSPSPQPAATSDDVIDDIDAKLHDDDDSPDELVATTQDAKRTESAESDWKRQNGSRLLATITEMRSVVGMVKRNSKDVSEAMSAVADDAANRGFVRKYLTKLTIAGFKVAFAGAKAGAGAGAETATVVGVPLDTIVDAVAVALDALIFASTTTASVVGMAQTFGAIKDSIMAMMSFDGGLPGCAANVDALFVALERAGLKKRAQEFMGSLVSLFERFVKWGAPIIGSVIGLAIPYDASITGRVVEFFLYAVTLANDKGWPLISRLWSILPSGWQALIASKARLSEFFVSFVDLMKHLFPAGTDNWKSRLIDKTRAFGVSSLSLHPLVVISGKRAVVRDRLTKGAEMTKAAAAAIDRKVTQWLDAVLIPNMDKLVTVVHGAMGLGFSLIYAMHAYTPDGAKRTPKLSNVPIDVDLPTLAAHLRTDNQCRANFAADVLAHRHQMCEAVREMPTRKGMLFVMMCIDAGIHLDPSVPHMGIPELATAPFELHRNALFLRP